MHLKVTPDSTGFAPPDSQFSAIDNDTYDGPGSPIGLGETAEAAAIALLRQMKDGEGTLPYTVMLCAPDTLCPSREHILFHVEGYFPMHAVANARDMAMDQYDAWNDGIDPEDFAIVFVGHGHQHSLA